ncbi:MAG: general secretion pathway protein G [Flavobacteriales bacterium]|jgi:general secretion pathway protein G
MFAKQRAKGFSLIEIMVVLVIIGMLATLVAPQVLGVLKKGSESRLLSDFATIEGALERYKAENYIYPTTEQGLDALVNEPTSEPRPKSWSGYLKKTPKDPWKNTYQYLNPGETKPYDVYSLGADGLRGGVDEAADVSVWDEPEDNN